MSADLAARAVACKAWRWMPGMLAVCVHDPWRVLRYDGSRVGWRSRVLSVHPRYVRLEHGTTDVSASDWLPDLADPATLGCLLALVREAWGEPTLCVACVGETVIGQTWGWMLPMRGGRFDPLLDAFGLTEAEALVRALEVAP